MYSPFSPKVDRASLHGVLTHSTLSEANSVVLATPSEAVFSTIPLQWSKERTRL